ncbi:hypothetical protein SAVIM338S_03918 [Streptomyces avidinii]
MATLALAGIAMAAWAAWLGWDQHRDVHPDGSTTGPYAAWQVIGLVLTLAVPVYWAASRRHPVAAVFGTSAGLAAAAAYDWSDDSSGLFVIGVALVMTGGLAATGLLTLVASMTSKRPPGTDGNRPAH